MFVIIYTIKYESIITVMIITYMEVYILNFDYVTKQSYLNVSFQNNEIVYVT